MAVLTKPAILKEIKAGRIKISNFDKKNLGPASYDLTLSNEYRVFKKPHETYHIKDKSDYREITELIVSNKPFTIMPGEAVHAITKETITLPNDICGWLQGRSRFARLGLMVHITAAFMQPGISNRQVLELFNASPFPLALKPGLKLCQFIFERCEGEAKYSGRFKAQSL